MARTPFVAGTDATSDLPDADTFGKLQDEWNTFLNQPSGRAALLTAGLQLMQPPSFGDTPVSQIGRAIGAAGETLGRTEAMDLRQAEAGSKAELRSAQAEAAGANAQTRAMGADVARERLGLKERELEIRKEDVQSKIALREAQSQAIPIRTEAQRLRGEAAAAKTDTDKRNLELRARDLDLKAQDLESKAKARSDRADAVLQSLDLRREEGAGRREDSALNRGVKASALYQDYQKNRIFTPGQPELSFQEFKAKYGLDGDGGGATSTVDPSGTAPVRVNSEAEAQRLTPGTLYETPDGQRYVR